MILTLFAVVATAMAHFVLSAPVGSNGTAHKIVLGPSNVTSLGHGPVVWPNSTGLALPGTTNGASTNSEEDVKYWCSEWDLNDPGSVYKLWVEGGGAGGFRNAIGPRLADFAKDVHGADPANHKWADHMMQIAQPFAGDNGLAGCGIPGGECNPNIECEDLASRGYGYFYWALRSLVGMHSKMNIAHEYLQDVPIENTLSLSEIASDFTAPPSMNSLDFLASALGAILYFIGGTAGMAGIAVSASANTARAAAQSARIAGLNRAKNFLNTVPPGGAVGAVVAQKAADIDKAIANAKAIVTSMAGPKTASALKFTGTMGASTYFVGGAFGLIGWALQPPTNGQITSGDLEPVLKGLFSQARDQIAEIGRMAAGHAASDADYSILPGEQAPGFYFDDEANNPIANFYSYGKMLLSDSDPTFNQTIELGFASFRPRIVDMALQKSNFKVVALTGYEDEKSCLESKIFGTRYVYNYCVNLYQDIGEFTTCEGDHYVQRTYCVASEAQHKALTDKYGYDIFAFYKAQIDCAQNHGKPGEPDLINLPKSGDAPLCWFATPAVKGEWEDQEKNFEQAPKMDFKEEAW